MKMARASARKHRHSSCWLCSNASGGRSTPRTGAGALSGHLFLVSALLVIFFSFIVEPAAPARASGRHESLAPSAANHENAAHEKRRFQAARSQEGEGREEEEEDDDDDELKQLSSVGKSLKQRPLLESANYRSLSFEQQQKLLLKAANNVTSFTAGSKFTRRRKRRSSGQKSAVGKQPEQATVRRQVIQAMLRGQVVLPCILDPPLGNPSSTPANEDDAPVLVLWYKDKSSVPIYSVDARSTPVQEARHKPGPYLEGRSTLRIQSSGRSPNQQQSLRRRRRSPDPGAEEEESPPLGEADLLAAADEARADEKEPQLESDSGPIRKVNRSRRHKRRPQAQMVAQLAVDSLSSEDNGLYSCRVDFRKARARTQEFELRIIVPADKPVIRDLSQPTSANKLQKSSSLQLLGPHSEGARLLLECETQGGYPEPSLSWWRDGRLIDDSYEIVSGADGRQLELAPDRFRSSAAAAASPLQTDTNLQQQQEQDSEQQFAAAPLGSGPQVDAAAATDDDRGQAAAAGQAAPSKPARLIRNRLELGPLTRADLMANYSCQAWNTKLSEPPTTSVMIDMNLRPIKVQIENERQPVLADKALELLCNAYGSRPAAVISWWRGQQRLTGDKGQQPAALASSNVTSSSLSLVPRLEDAGQLIRCRAESPASALAQDSPAPDFIEDSWRLELHYLPRVKLALGEKLQGTSIREGQDVYFECSAKAQPPAHEVRWWFEGKELETNVSSGVIISNQSLVLQRVKRQQRGRYTCSAANQVGESHSNAHHLRVQHAPICRDTSASEAASPPATRHKSYYGAARMEPVRVQCHVEADPPEPLAFKWAFVATSPGDSPNSIEQHSAPDKGGKQQPEFSGQQLVYLDASSVQQPSGEDPLLSVATYTPRSELDYGTLLCWATSPLGQQQEPCSYQVVPAERPDPLRNCRLANASDIQLTVACEPGYDGGVDQSFRMEVYEAERRQLVANVSGNGAILPANWLDNNNGGNNNNGANNAFAIATVGGTGDGDGDEELPLLPATQQSGGQVARQQRQRTVGAGALQLSGGRQSGELAAPAAGPQPLEAVFMTQPSLEPATDYFLSIYSSNAKGASKPVSFTVSTQQGALGGARQVAANSFARDARRANGEPSHLLSDVLQLSWSPFLMICVATIVVFVMFASITFALMKYVDFSPASATFYMGDGGAAAGTSSQPSSCTGYDDSDRRPMNKLAFGRGATRKSKSSSRARVITLTGSGQGDGGSGSSSSGSSSSRLSQSSLTTRSKQHDNVLFGQRSRFGLHQNVSQSLRPSNSDLQLNAATYRTTSMSGGPGRASLCGTLPKNNNHLQLCHQFNTAYLQAEAGAGDPSAGDNPLGQNQLTALMLSKPSCSYNASNDGRVEQLVISGKQYVHQTSLYRTTNNATPPQKGFHNQQQQQHQRHLQLTGAADCLASSPYGSLLRTHHHHADGNNNNLYAGPAVQDRLVCIAPGSAASAPSNFRPPSNSGDIIDGSYAAAGGELQTPGYNTSSCQLDPGLTATGHEQLTGAESEAGGNCCSANGNSYTIVASDVALATVVNNNNTGNNINCSSLHCHLSDCNNATTSPDGAIHTNESDALAMNQHQQLQHLALHPISSVCDTTTNTGGDSDGMSNGTQRSISTTLTTGSPSSAGLTDLEQQQKQLYNQARTHHHLYSAHQPLHSNIAGKPLASSVSGSTTSTLTSTTTDQCAQDTLRGNKAQQASPDGIVRIISNSTIKKPSIAKKNLAQIQDFIGEPGRELYEIQPLEHYTMYVGSPNGATYDSQAGHQQFFVLPASDAQRIESQQLNSLTRSNKARVKLMTPNETTKIPVQYQNNYMESEEREANGCSQTTGSGLHTDV